ncbi:DNA helicase [Tanacetum coccineum]
MLESVVVNPLSKKTTLTEWLYYNEHHTDGRHINYLNFPSEFVWYADGKYCSHRRRRNKSSIGRLSYIHPTLGKTFLCKTIIYALRSEGRIMLAVASSGKTVMLGGNFRKTLPVKKSSRRDEIISSSVVESYTETCKKQTRKKYRPLHSGRVRTYISFDDTLPHGYDGGEVELLYPKEYLNTLSFAGLPPHRLELKIGIPIMLLHNVNIVGGLCNGTRLIVKQLLPRVIEA